MELNAEFRIQFPHPDSIMNEVRTKMNMSEVCLFQHLTGSHVYPKVIQDDKQTPGSRLTFKLLAKQPCYWLNSNITD